MPFTDKYSVSWNSQPDALQIEFQQIRLGKNLSLHYENSRKLMWPHLDSHRWESLCRDEILKNKVTVLMGAGSTGKTHSAAWIYLIDYLVYPDETLVMVSSTDLRGLELRVWGEIKTLHSLAVQKFPWLAGNLIDSKHCICTDDLEEDEARDLRKGIIGIPTVQNGRNVGLGKWIGVKQKRIRLIADEAQFMSINFLSAFSNLDKNVDFRAIVLGNPNDPLDPLGKAAEPIDGWTTHLEPDKTAVWKTRFMNGTCVNLIGTDSPNFDYPENQPAKFPYLISREKIANTLSFFSKDSAEYYSQCVGAMKIGVLARRVLTRDMCRQFGAQDSVIWKDGKTTKVYFVDSSYGGDRCVAGGAEFGEDVSGKNVISFFEPKIIPILIGIGKEPEYQIAEFVKQDCESLGISPSQMGHDATGRGSLGTAMARIWSAETNPIESGGNPTDRPVCLDLFIIDKQTNQKRLKLCSEHYDRLVSEFWYSVRYAVESSQIRNLPEEAMDELCTRKWDFKKDKISIEVKDGTPTRPGMKQRTGKSPDMGDWAAGIVEMARRSGFKINKLAIPQKKSGQSWFQKEAESLKKLAESKQLQRA